VAWKGAAWTVTGADGALVAHGGLHAVLFYLGAYLFMNLGAFTVAMAVERATGGESIEQYQGLAKRSPFLAISMTIFLLSLSGIPPLAGFLGKFYVFNAAIRAAGDAAMTIPLPLAGLSVNVPFWLAIAGVINSAIAVYYYMNVVRLMYFRPARVDATDEGLSQTSAGVHSVVIVTLVITLLLGILPEVLVRFLSTSVLPGGLG
jgi:NADH-quinone oxidoreductase subunit N